MSQREDASEDRQCLWANLEIRAKEAQPSAQDLWLNLKDRLDFSKHKPKAVSTVEVSKQTFRGREYFIIKNTQKNTYLQMDEKGFFLWNLMDGKHSLTDLTLAYILEYGTPPFHQLISLLSSLKNNSLLEEKTSNIYELLLNRASPNTLRPQLARLWSRFSQGEVSIDADRYFDWIYHNGGWLLYTSPAKVLWVILSISGSILFLREFFNPRYDLSSLGQFGLDGVLSLFLLNLALVFLHEHGHGLTVKSYGRKVIKGGFLVYFGEPCFFVDTTDMWLGTRNQRIAVSWAGPFTTILIASICSIAIAVFPSSPFVPLLFGISVLGISSALMNLSPLLEWDGYYMLMNYLEMPSLRAKSFDFLRTQLWQKLKSGQREFCQEETIFTVFGIMAGVWSIIAISLIPYFWTKVIYPVFEPIWAGQGIVVRIILMVIGLLLILSVISSVVMMIWREAQRIWNASKHLRNQ
ncbi:Uncharacterised protein [uncultured archaeon]|nr:Uncharacterised protein [uncultured archaeon]